MAENLMILDETRFERQIAIPEIGVEGQKILKDSHITIVGAGGLGSAAAFYLGAAGVGHITLVDHDVVDPTNLNRQILHWEKDVGRPKVVSALEKLQALNSNVDWRGLCLHLDADNAARIFGESRLILDCLDNFDTRYVINRVAVRMNIPFIHAACRGFEGRVSLIIPGKTPCLECFIPNPPEREKFPIVGFAAGIIGLFQVAEAVKYLVGMSCTLAGKLLLFDGNALLHRIIEVERDPDCPVCGKGIRE